MYSYHQESHDRKRRRQWSPDRSFERYKRQYQRSPSESSADSSSVNDEIGHFNAVEGSLITDRCSSYLLLSKCELRFSCLLSNSDVVRKELGKGTFGKVFSCKDKKYNDSVAIKVIRSIKRYVESAKIEADILDDIFTKQKASGTDMCVKMFSQFRLDGNSSFGKTLLKCFAEYKCSPSC